MRESGRLGRIHFARTNYLSRVTDWYSGWEWCRTVKGGGSHLLAAGCHAVDALRWATGLEIAEVSAYHMKVTPGYEWPTTIDVNVRFEGGALGHVTSTTDFQMPYLRHRGDGRLRLDPRHAHPLEGPADRDRRAAIRQPVPRPMTLHGDVRLGGGSPAIRIDCVMPDSADVTHHPFQAEIDDFIDAILAGRETMLNVFDAQRTMEVCGRRPVGHQRPGQLAPAHSLATPPAAGRRARRQAGNISSTALVGSGFASVCRFWVTKGVSPGDRREHG
jgi:predicted dehydrogenase